jgi:predicted xylose isomerase-like sugar epimerase
MRHQYFVNFEGIVLLKGIAEPGILHFLETLLNTVKVRGIIEELGFRSCCCLMYIVT